ncbi:MAG: hypothetical protein ABI378_13865, partial [Chitinophagaceae bacterium]
MKKLLLVGLLLTPVIGFAQLKIGNNPATIDPSSILELENPNKALYMTRVSLTSTSDVTTVPAPKAGMMVYNTNTTITATNPVYLSSGVGVYYFDGTGWVYAGTNLAGNNFWNINGNNNVADGVNFLGTTNNVALNFRVFNQKAGRIDLSGNAIYGYQAGSTMATGGTLDNTLIGSSAGAATTTGIKNTGVGSQALQNNGIGYNNVGVGYRAGADLADLHDNTYLGYNTNATNIGITNATAIGSGTQITQSNSVILGNNASVGIGNNAPTNKLHVTGTDPLRLETLTSNPVIPTNEQVVTVDNTGVLHRSPFAAVISPITASNGLTRNVNDIQLGGTLSTATNITTAGYDLSLTGTGNLNVANDVNTKNLNATGNAGVTGTTTTGALTVTNNATVGGTLAVTGVTTTNGITNTGNIGTGTLATTSGATVGSTLGVTGATTTTGITNTGNIGTDGLNVTNNTTTGTLNAGASTLGNTTTGTLGAGNTAITGTLSAGASTLGNTTTGILGAGATTITGGATTDALKFSTQPTTGTSTNNLLNITTVGVVEQVSPASLVSAGIQAENGTSISGGKVRLGGNALITPTTIATDGTNTLVVNSTGVGGSSVEANQGLNVLATSVNDGTAKAVALRGRIAQTGGAIDQARGVSGAATITGGSITTTATGGYFNTNIKNTTLPNDVMVTGVAADAEATGANSLGTGNTLAGARFGGDATQSAGAKSAGVVSTAVGSGAANVGVATSAGMNAAALNSRLNSLPATTNAALVAYNPGSGTQDYAAITDGKVQMLNTPAGSSADDIVTIDPTTNVVHRTGLSTLGGLITADNGLNKSSANNVQLGGGLVKQT